jgi:hypothetical protein
MLRLTYVALALSIAACGAEESTCVLDGDCPGTEVCVIGRCVQPSTRPSSDAGHSRDTGLAIVDAGRADSGSVARPDSGLRPDSGPMLSDAGNPVFDSGPAHSDAGPPNLDDAGRPPPDDAGGPLTPVGLVISEVLYDLPGVDAEQEWVELYNGGARELNLAGFSIAYGGTSWTSGNYELMGTLAAGDCVVVGGPASAAGNGNPQFIIARDFAPDIQNSGTRADGVAIFNLPAAEVTANSVPIDTVLYGRENSSQLIGSDGQVLAEVDVGDSPASSSIERIGEVWSINPAPSPGVCLVR